jgi:uncharacterized protein (TIGR03083 family)
MAGPEPEHGGDHPCVVMLADVWGAVAAVGRGFDDEDWDRRTDCPGWSVRDQVSHLIGTESTRLGRPAPDPVERAGPHVRNPMGEYNETWVAARRDLPGRSVLAEFEEVTALRLAALRAMTPEELSAPGPSPIGTVPYATFMDVRVMDSWVHEQDIRRAVGLPWRIDGPAAASALERIAATFGYAVGKRVAPPDGTVVTLDVTGDLARTLAVVVRAGRAVPADPGAEPTVRVTMATPTWVCLATGRWTPAEAGERASITVDGDGALGAAVVAHLAQMP